ncbi:helix-turn-helix domain containing protein [Thalassococcus sp. CAU 1522]|uniref:Helix-turn-helix domain containing protein n=1 Tax=Thalassococcus arenae TaxID=2851652 RepID=A0ABS6NAD3_9RHOB|nr:helix-turn-helix domain-containing protein [Thalassococcus arenae]MBV2360985.1 helix-turn-helix domain containing protein [Thalassococcus arenae]
MAKDAEGIIVALKRRFRVETDQGLADRLKLGRSTVASWRRRGSVPERYARFADRTEFDLFGLGVGDWDAQERAASVLAMMRMHNGYLKEISNYPDFLRRGGGIIFNSYTLHLENAFLDLQSAMETQGIDDPWKCLNLMVYQEYFEEGQPIGAEKQTGN